MANGRTPGPPAADNFNLFISIYNDQQHFTYFDQTGNLQDAWYGLDGWHLQQITTTDGSTTIPGEYLIPTPGPQPLHGSIFVSVYNDQQHFTYTDVNYNLQDVWYGSDGWHRQQLTTTDGSTTIPGEYLIPTPGPQAEGDSLSLFVSIYNDQQHFTYTDVNFNIQDVWYGPDGWHLQQLSEGPTTIPGEYLIPTPGPKPSSGSIFVSVYNNQQHFTYTALVGSDIICSTIHDLWYGSDGWHLQQLTEGPSPIPGEYLIPILGPPSPCEEFPLALVSTYNDQQHFTYINCNGSLQDVWYGPDGWHRQQLTTIDGSTEIPGEYLIPTPGPAAVGSMSVSVYNGQQHFTYPDLNNNLQDIWYGPDGWHLQQLSEGPTTIPGEYLIPTPGPKPSLGSIFVSIYNGQQHFAYLDNDNSGTIWDVWYSSDGWHLQQINNG
ncbi:MAG: hypothetical protein ACU4EQ_06505 [Candidatus Nitrosoglobus sp.]